MFLFPFLLNIFTIYIPLVLIGYFMPNFVKKTLLFGVVIPEEVSNSQEVKNITRLYKRNYGISSLLSSILLNIVAFKTENISYSIIGIVILIFLMGINYVYIHNQAKRLKREKGWTINKKQMIIVDTNHRYDYSFLSIYWFLLPITIFIFTLLFTIIQYPNLPDQIPKNFDFTGRANIYSNKNFTTVFEFPLVQAGMTVLFLFIYWMIKRVRPNINAARPKTSSLQNKIAKRYWMLYILTTLTVMNLQFSFLQLKVLQVISPSIAVNIFLNSLGIGFPLIGALLVAIKTGQSGNRIKVEMDEELNNQVIDREDDSFWKWGMFYYNPDDPSLFIEKRFGIGWTVNFANIWGKILMALIIIVIILALLL